MGSSCGRVPAMGRGPAGAAAGVRGGPRAAPLHPALPSPTPPSTAPPPSPAETTGAAGRGPEWEGHPSRACPWACARLGPHGQSPPCPRETPATPPTVLWAGGHLRVLVCPRGRLSSCDLECTGKAPEGPWQQSQRSEGTAGLGLSLPEDPRPAVELVRVPRAFSPSAQPASEDPGRS